MSTSDSEVTSRVEAVMARIRASIPSSGRSLTALVSPRPLVGNIHLFPEDVYRSLHQARTIGGGISVNYVLGWRTPIIGQAWLIVRRRIHQEIRIYLDALTAQQSNLNTHLLRSLTGVVETLDSLGLRVWRRQQEEHAAAIAALQEEVRALRREVDALQARLTSLNAANGEARAQG